MGFLKGLYVKIISGVILLVLVVVGVYIAIDYSANSVQQEDYLSSLDNENLNSKQAFANAFYRVYVLPDGSTQYIFDQGTGLPGDYESDGFTGMEPGDSVPPSGGNGNGSNGPISNGTTIDFTNNGYDSYIYSYMGWQMVTSKSSAQYKWRQKHFPNWVNDKYGVGDPTAFNSEGFGVVQNRYVIAVSDERDGGIGHVGQALDVYLENGIVLPCVVGDIKSAGDADWTKWGHKKGNQMNTVEFIVDRKSWYNGHANPGTNACHPEWKSRIIKIVKGGDV